MAPDAVFSPYASVRYFTPHKFPNVKHFRNRERGRCKVPINITIFVETIGAAIYPQDISTPSYIEAESTRFFALRELHQVGDAVELFDQKLLDRRRSGFPGVSLRRYVFRAVLGVVFVVVGRRLRPRDRSALLDGRSLPPARSRLRDNDLVYEEPDEHALVVY